MSITPRSLGKYELQERLGQGGMAEVWKAWDSQLQRYVAIKILHTNLQNDPDFLKRFEREAQVIASLHHPNIVQIYDFQVSRPPESERSSAYMVMDYVEGQTLADYIRSTSRVGRFPPISDIIHLFTSISNAVDYAHKKGMIHRDIKPANILLDRRNPMRSSMGKPILTDFGIVKMLGVSTGTLSGTWLGTPLYISPEQAQGHAGNECSDIYSLGIILYEICTGMPPFRGENPLAIIMQHIHMPPSPPATLNPHIPPALSDVILRSLAKDPMARFASASTMTTALAQALNMSIPEMPSISTTPVNAGTTPVLTAPGPLPVANAIQHTPVTTRVLSTPSSPSPSPTLPPQLPPTTPLTQRRRGLFIALAVLLLLVLVGASLGTFLILSHVGTNSAVANSIVGHALFTSSEELTEGSINGVEDGLHLTLHNIASPAPGKSYYLWLLGDNNQNPMNFISLGTVQVTHREVDYTYTTPRHANLIATTSRLLITEESTNPAPSRFSTDHRTWRYYAEITQTLPTTGDPDSSLSYLRRLLYKETKGNSPKQSMQAGTDIQVLRETQKVLEWADNAKDAWGRQDIGLTYDQAIHILGYLDGPYIQTDIPSGTPDPRFSETPLITLSNDQIIDSYLHNLQSEVFGAGHTPDVSPERRQLTDQISLEIDQVERWLELVRQDAKQLVQMSSTQLRQPTTLTILNDMLKQALYAFSGKLDTSTGEMQAGMVQVHYNIQRLASFDVKKL